MIHLFKHKAGKNKGTFDFAIVNKGKYISGSNQGYERKIDCWSAIRSVMKSFDSKACFVQDNTETKPVVYTLLSTGEKAVSGTKAKPAYVPNKKEAKVYPVGTVIVKGINHFTKRPHGWVDAAQNEVIINETEIGTKYLLKSSKW